MPTGHGDRLSRRQFANFHSALIKAAPWDITQQTAQQWIDNPKALARALRHTLCAWDPPEIEADTIIQVEPSMSVEYPFWVDWPLYPEEKKQLVPAQYDLTRLAFWRHPEQGKNISGHKVHEYLKANNMIPRCLGLYDGLAIQQKGLEVARLVFEDHICAVLWRDVVRRRGGQLFVPCLRVAFTGVVVDWLNLDQTWLWDMPAARYPS